MSWSLHGAGTGELPTSTETLSKVVVLSTALLWELTTKPMVTWVFMGTAMDPTWVQLTPSGESSATKLFPIRCNDSHSG